MHLAKKACTSYLKGVHVMKDKSVFKLAEVDAEKLARSYGLLNAPKLTIVSKKGELRDRLDDEDASIGSDNQDEE